MFYRRAIVWGRFMLGAYFAASPQHRILILIALSLLIHVLLLWWPNIHLHHDCLEFAPLTVTLEHGKKSSVQPVTPVAVTPITPAGSTAAKVAQAKISLATAKANTSVPSVPIQQHSDVPPSSQVAPVAAPIQPHVEQVENATAIREQLLSWELHNPRKFPKKIMVTYWIHESGGGLKSGDLICQFESSNEKYLLKTQQNSNNPLALLTIAHPWVRISNGTFGNQGLRPETFTSEGNKQNSQITFDWSSRKLIFADRGASETSIYLLDNAQDSVSLLFQYGFLYKKSLYPVFKETIPIAVLGDHQIEQYELEVFAQENVETPLGVIRALHLRRLHHRGESYFEIWLGAEDFLLPVKFHTVSGEGKVTDEYLISDIRVSE